MTKQTNMSDMAPEDTMLDVANNEDYTNYVVLFNLLEEEDGSFFDIISDDEDTFRLRLFDGTKYTYLSKEYKRSIKPIVNTKSYRAVTVIGSDDYYITIGTSNSFAFDETSVEHGLSVCLVRNDTSGKLCITSIDEILINALTGERYCEHSYMFFTGRVGTKDDPSKMVNGRKVYGLSDVVHIEIKCDKCGHTEWERVGESLVNIDGTSTASVHQHLIQEQQSIEDDHASARS